MKFAPFLCASLLLALAAPASAEIYRWVDSAGRVHFGDQPPGDIDRVQQMPKQTLPDNAEVVKLRQAAEKAPVTLYITDCGAPCSQATALLQGRGIPFTTRQVDKDPEAVKALRQLTGQLQVPTLKIGDNVQKGFEKVMWNNLLDLAGYPRAKNAASEKATADKAKTGK
jgi:glutaredoxin